MIVFTRIMLAIAILGSVYQAVLLNYRSAAQRFRNNADIPNAKLINTVAFATVFLAVLPFIVAFTYALLKL